MSNTETWYGYTREEYYELVKQPQDPEWEDLIQDSEAKLGVDTLERSRS